MEKEIMIEGKIEIKENQTDDEYRKSFIFYINGVDVSDLILDLWSEEIVMGLPDALNAFFNIRTVNYNSYVEFLEKQGFEIKAKKTHWKPKKNEIFYHYGIYSEEIKKTVNEDYDVVIKLISNYFAFPTELLAKKCKDISKLDRLQVLYQYNNDILFEPNWGNDNEKKYRIIVNNGYVGGVADFIHSTTYKSQGVLWKNEKDLEEFIELYEKEILELLGGQ